MKILIDDTTNQRCIKIINSNGLEIIAKEQSCSGRRDGINLFLDSSVGCDLKCSYCWLTKHGKHNTQLEVSNEEWRNLLTIILNKLETQQWTQDRNYFVKFMGQGDPFRDPLNTLRRVDILEDCLCERDLILGGISYSSIFPKNVYFNEIESLICRFGTILEPRVYISVGSFIDNVRRKLFPNASSLQKSLTFLSKKDIDLRLHWTPLDIMDIDQEIENCFKLMNIYSVKHIRVIPYNSKTDSKLKKYKDINNLVKTITDRGYSCDCLISTGHSINGACGMFSSRKD